MLSIIYIIPLLKSRKKLYYFNDLFSLVIMKNLTIEKNIKKYLKEQNIETILTGKDLLNFAVSVRKAELDKLIIESKQCKDLIRKYEIESLKKQEYNELFFISEGIQEMDYSVWDYADTEIILNGKNYFEYFTSFIDVSGKRITIHLKNNTIKHITKNELLEIFDSLFLYFIDENKNIVKKKAIKVFLTDTLYKKQKYEEIKDEEQKDNNIYKFLNDFKNRNYICNNENYNDKKGISGYFLFLDYLDFCNQKKTKPEQKKIFIQECKNNFKWIYKSKRIASEVIKDTCFFIN